MIDKQGKLPITRQCELLTLNRSGVYYTPRPVPEEDLRLMRRIDELHLEFPYYGARKISEQLGREGRQAGRLHVGTLMRLMGIEAQYCKPRTSIPSREDAIYPYLLSGVKIARPNHVWSTDITYLPMAHGFLYLTAILDIFSRKVLAFRLSNTLATDFCVDALEDALHRYGKPEIVNTDQGSQYTSEAWTGALKAQGIRISMDGKGRWVDNVFVERLWRSTKHEEVYRHGYRDGLEARQRLAAYYDQYNHRRLHEALDYRTPEEVYRGLPRPRAAAAQSPLRAA
jgi:putative transposase